ncbi:flagellar hook-associated protein 1 FlgK [Meinhardsimonia xiamenensis]|jgi:flagellar hook-associated protein 1 FlgK|uniref:Flagellar hook-associated protein 1 n=1 Tax=Meinhardsimonia xiamenensis TaxID=990712 RepID=A0A1G9EFL3_9RHOB|nr:flagellar hook-associated protein FlgK [Meinhardsimonia xiamenensis]PRX33792.1 flagellar hook-associated protein 1 FlgK [Meinhardsimonia xiamenensis]SDK74853.1 flagellar hook-associated protein 1 FlgK [Meinhardsimonia xiamenensis]
MSISSAMTAALSGLGVASRNAEVISGNVSNALTEGYARRELQRATQVLDGQGNGVRVAGILRHTDLQLLQDRRTAEASRAATARLAEFHANAEKALGTPDQAGSLSARLADLDAALISAASRPDSGARLEDIARRAEAVATKLNEASALVQQERMRADAAIGEAVATINTTLEQLAEVNGQIARLSAARRDTSALADEQQRLVDRIATLVPVRIVPQDHGRIALYSLDGAPLLEGRPARLEFTPVGVITPEMTLAGGALSGLALNGRPVATSGGSARLGGGELAALFALRDTEAPALQARLDAVARDLVERLSDPASDPTLAAGAPGLFTDAGAAFSGGDETGLAARIFLNPLVDPAAGELWRLRDGLAAAAPGPPGDARILQARREALLAPRVPASGDFGGVARTSEGLISDLVSGVAAERQASERDESFAAARSETLRQMELEGGVDTDMELQILMQVEQAFAANARVLTTLDELLQAITRI